MADEMRKLAENSSKSAVDISGILKKVEKDSLKIMNGIQAGLENIRAGTSWQETSRLFIIELKQQAEAFARNPVYHYYYEA